MKRKLAVIIITGLALRAPGLAHRLDEYLQAIMIGMSEDHMEASMRLIPGVAVSSAITGAVDLNGDGVFSEAEQQRYAQQVFRDLIVRVDGQKLTPVLRSVTFPALTEIREGLGEIHIEFAADLPSGSAKRALTIENHFQPATSVYLMNCLAPQSRNIRVLGQNRNQNQSYYRLDYLQSGAQNESYESVWRARLVSASATFTGVPSMFRLGMRHIAEGTDHLLFLIALLLPAPLLSRRYRWSASNDVRPSLIQILRVVTAFTIGHSITLALGASGLVSLPERLVEVLIAFSILISALHALRPLFPGREPVIAAGFGLIHGLAFATTLQKLGVGAWQRVASILGFNLGIETMQLVVVAAILPSLIMLSRTPAYSSFRLIGALFAAFASIGWMVERIFGVDYSVDLAVDCIAQRGAWMAVGLFGMSIVSWLSCDTSRKPRTIAEQPSRPALEGI
jgi:hypothetical protein